MSKDDFRILVTQAMDRRGIRTKKEIAERANRDASWVSRITTGSFKETPPPADLEILREILGVTPSMLLSALGYDLDIDEERLRPTDYRLIEVSDEWENLTEEERGWIISIIDTNKKRREARDRALAVAEESVEEYSVSHG